MIILITWKKLPAWEPDSFFLIFNSFTLCLFLFWPSCPCVQKVILAWLPVSCHSSLVLNGPSSELPPDALMWRGPSHSPPRHPSLLSWHLVVSGLFLLCSSILCLQMIAQLLQCHTPSTGTALSRSVARGNEQKERQSCGPHPSGALECHTGSLRAMFNRFPLPNTLHLFVDPW